ncbi:hypothetical protein N9053_01630 [bacterium]|nr:hypothetical protein [bacterium]
MHNLNPHNKNEKSLDDRDLTGDCKNQCLQYLLNELEPDQIALFEETLGNSEQLAEELQRQAEMIAILSELPVGGTNLSTLPKVDHSLRKSFAKLACVALAVCIAGLAFRTWWSATGPGQRLEPSNTFLTDRVSIDAAITAPLSESTLIARAWAAGQAEKDSGVLSETTLTDLQPIALGDDFEFQDEETGAASDGAFSWIFTASFETQEAETNDG